MRMKRLIRRPTSSRVDRLGRRTYPLRQVVQVLPPLGPVFTEQRTHVVLQTRGEGEKTLARKRRDEFALRWSCDTDASRWSRNLALACPSPELSETLFLPASRVPRGPVIKALLL